MAKYKIIAPVEYITGHLRYGHYEGELELTEEELQKINENPNLLREYDLDLIIDDYRVDDVGCIMADDVSFKEC